MYGCGFHCARSYFLPISPTRDCKTNMSLGMNTGIILLGSSLQEHQYLGDDDRGEMHARVSDLSFMRRVVLFCFERGFQKGRNLPVFLSGSAAFWASGFWCRTCAAFRTRSEVTMYPDDREMAQEANQPNRPSPNRVSTQRCLYPRI